MCDGGCLRSFHPGCLDPEDRPSPGDPERALWYCPTCQQGQVQCSVCGASGVAGHTVFKCRMANCGLHFHPACLDTLSTTTDIKYSTASVRM